jgi:hypothetical protein
MILVATIPQFTDSKEACSARSPLLKFILKNGGNKNIGRSIRLLLCEHFSIFKEKG